MSHPMPEQTLPSTQDVVICGGGFAGLLLARHLRQEMPELSVAVIDRMARPLPDAAAATATNSFSIFRDDPLSSAVLHRKNTYVRTYTLN